MGYCWAIFTNIAGRLRGYCQSIWRQFVWYTSAIKHQNAQSAGDVAFFVESIVQCSNALNHKIALKLRKRELPP